MRPSAGHLTGDALEVRLKTATFALAINAGQLEATESAAPGATRLNVVYGHEETGNELTNVIEVRDSAGTGFDFFAQHLSSVADDVRQITGVDSITST